tara:strand:- start:1515 stop:2714 length:1200 start_codon:yes stop_codon:yes gene_type:complete
MLNKKNFSLNSSSFYTNLKKTKKIFNFLKTDLNNQIPLLQSFEKNYPLDFSPTLVKKFSQYKNIIIIGVGGSILGTKCIYHFLKNKIKKEVFFFDNLDQNLFFELKKIKNLKNSCFVVISKSGNTLETITNLSVVFSKNLIKKNLVIITELKDNNLLHIGNKLKASIIEHKDFIGGRYSVFSEVGMFPAALMGLNIQKFRNIKKLVHDKEFISSLLKSVTSIYTLYKRGINNSVILNYDTDLNELGLWYQQLISESLGKNGKGITPIVSTAPRDHHSMLQLYLDGPKDKFYTFLSTHKKNSNYKVFGKIIPSEIGFLKNKTVESIVNAQLKATLNIYTLKNIPFRHFKLKKNNEEELGKIFTFFILETILLGRLFNTNVFDQPAVEQIKNETKKILLKK